MSVVVPMSQLLRREPVSETSPLLFDVYERPLYYKGKEGREYGDTNHKALVRMFKDNPVVLAVVQNTYQTVQNAELFARIENGLGTAMRDEKYDIRDRISYSGAKCFREYVFPSIKVDSPDRDTIAFRIIVENGFGRNAIKMHSGAIDFFCTNGMVRGDYESTYARHTKGLVLSKFEDNVKRAVDIFWKDRNMWNELRATVLKDDELVQKWLADKFGDRLGGRLFHQYLIEAKARGGRNKWALYSALTYYSSHAQGDFALRNTGNDHAASTMINREHQVRLAFGSLLQLAA